MISVKKIASGLTTVTILVGVVTPADHGKSHAAEHTTATYFGTILLSTGVFAPADRVQYAHPIEILRDSVTENMAVATATFLLS